MAKSQRNRAEGEARFHRLLVQLVEEFEVLRCQEKPAVTLEAELTETGLSPADAEPSAGHPRVSRDASRGRLKRCIQEAPEVEAQEPPQQKAEEAATVHAEEAPKLEFTSTASATTEESLPYAPLVPAPIFDLPDVLRKFYLCYADTSSGKLPWTQLREILQKCQGEDELDLLEVDVRAIIELAPEVEDPEPHRMRISTASWAAKEDELVISFTGFGQLMRGSLAHLEEAAKARLKQLRFLVEEEAEMSKLRPQLPQAKTSWAENLPVDYQTFVLEVAPAFVILANAAVIGISADDNPDASGWQVLELIFTLIFSLEAILRARWTGCRTYLTGPDAGWNYFDMLCLTCAYTDLLITGVLQATAEDDAPALSAIMLIKILRLARVCRIIRVMRFGAVRELRVIILGVLSGIRVLFWAIVLLFFTVYIIGVSARLLITDAEQFPEFSSVDASMLTFFRCVTDGCTDLAGQPLQEHLRIKYGSFFMLVYMVIFLFVVIGIFNLIMAVFLDSVVSDHATRELQELGYKYDEMEEMISNVIATLASGRRVEKKDQAKTFCSWICSLCVRQSHGLKKSMRLNVHKEMNKQVAVTRDEFNRWLQYPEMQELLTFCKIETATKFDLFDVLDADLGGQLHFNELVEGLMQLRGPITKCDVISLRLMMSNLLRSVMRIVEARDTPSRVVRYSSQHTMAA